jgi:hypothetical protein
MGHNGWIRPTYHDASAAVTIIVTTFCAAVKWASTKAPLIGSIGTDVGDVTNITDVGSN